MKRNKRFVFIYGSKMSIYPNVDEALYESVRVALESSKKFWNEMMQNDNRFSMIFNSVSTSLYSCYMKSFTAVNIDLLLEEDLDDIKERMYSDLGSFNDEDRLIARAIIDYINKVGVHYGN